MSLTSKVFLGLACTCCCGIITFVHYKQWSDQQKLHEGVLRDQERNQRKIQNLRLLQQEIELGNMLKSKQDEEGAVAHLLEGTNSSQS